MIKVLLADDQELIRQSLSFVMSRQEDIEMVGTAANGREALELVEEKQPDVVLGNIGVVNQLFSSTQMYLRVSQRWFTARDL